MAKVKKTTKAKEPKTPKPKKEERKTAEQIVEETGEIEINLDHVNDWHYCKSGEAFTKLKDRLTDANKGTFNMRAAETTPKSIRYRQRAHDFDGGKKGDYLFMDLGGGRMTVPYKIFKSLF
jgi:hypothetical protein